MQQHSDAYSWLILGSLEVQMSALTSGGKLNVPSKSILLSSLERKERDRFGE